MDKGWITNPSIVRLFKEIEADVDLRILLIRLKACVDVESSVPAWRRLRLPSARST